MTLRPTGFEYALGGRTNLARPIRRRSEMVEQGRSGQSAARRYAQVVVASRYSQSVFAANADFVCDGSNDEVEITQALDAYPTSPGIEVLLLDGDFHIERPITTSVSRDIEIHGLIEVMVRARFTNIQVSTLFTEDSFDDALQIGIGSADRVLNVAVSDLRIVSSYDPNQRAMSVRWASPSTKGVNIILRRLKIDGGHVFVASRDTRATMPDAGRVIISECLFRDALGTFPTVYVESADTLLIDNNMILDSSATQIAVGDARRMIIAGNKLEIRDTLNTVRRGIEVSAMEDGDYCIIAGNRIRGHRTGWRESSDTKQLIRVGLKGAQAHCGIVNNQILGRMRPQSRGVWVYLRSDSSSPTAERIVVEGNRIGDLEQGVYLDAGITARVAHNDMRGCTTPIGGPGTAITWGGNLI